MWESGLLESGSNTWGNYHIAAKSHIEPPTSEQLERFIRNTNREFEAQLLHQISTGLTQENKTQIYHLNPVGHFH